MASPEYKFQPQEFLVPDDKPGDFMVPAELEPPQTDPFTTPQTSVEFPQEIPFIEIESLDQNQDARSSISHVAQALLVSTDHIEETTPTIAGTIDFSSEEVRRRIQEDRRVQWEQTGEVQPIAGGSPRRRPKKAEEAPQPEKPIDRETAKKRMEEIFLNTHWQKITKEQKKQNMIAIRELRSLRKLYPDIYNEVFRKMMED